MKWIREVKLKKDRWVNGLGCKIGWRRVVRSYAEFCVRCTCIYHEIYKVYGISYNGEASHIFFRMISVRPDSIIVTVTTVVKFVY